MGLKKIEEEWWSHQKDKKEINENDAKRHENGKRKKKIFKKIKFMQFTPSVTIKHTMNEWKEMEEMKTQMKIIKSFWVINNKI